VTPVEFRGDLWRQKTTLPELSCGVVVHRRPYNSLTLPCQFVMVHFQWRNDGVAAASNDGDPLVVGGPNSCRVLSD